MKADGHIHTPFCPHGTKDALKKYIERAIQLHFDEITFTEHAPLPNGFNDPTPDKDSGMKMELLEDYITELTSIKKEYKDQLKINIGLEIDYIEGFEQETTTFLNQYGSYLDDSILSVHFLKILDSYYCMDFSPDTFQEMITSLGTTQLVYEKYYSTLMDSIQQDLGPHKPKRIGHITLVRKFQEKFPRDFSDQEYVNLVLDEIKKHHLQIDCNSAGLLKPLCKDSYPPRWTLYKAQSMGIPLVFGSDAHQAKLLGEGYELFQGVNLSSPTS